MIEHLVDQLNSPDREQRRQAIVALANAKDPAALKPLAAVYRTDPDPELRELALKAGRYIRQAMEQGQRPAGTGSGEQLIEGRAISSGDMELARNHLDAAFGHYINGDRARAVDYLGRALALNPALREEPFAANLIITLTGKSIKEGVPLLINPDSRAALIGALGGKQKLKAKPQGKGAENATWANVSLDLVIYWLVSALSIMILIIFVVDFLRDMINEMPESSTALSTTLTQEKLDQLADLSVVALIPLGLISGLYAVVAVLIQGAAIHAAATWFMGGRSLLVYLYRRLVPFQTVVTLGYSGVLVVLALAGTSSAIWVLFPILMIGGSVAVLYYILKLIAEVYDFGCWSSCGALVLSGLLLMGMWCLFQTVLAGVLGTLSGAG